MPQPLSQEQAAQYAVAEAQRHAQKGADRRVSCGDSHAGRVLVNLRQAQWTAILMRQAQDAASLGLGEAARGGPAVDAQYFVAGRILLVEYQYAAELRPAEFRRRVHDLLEQRVQVQLGGDGTGDAHHS